MLTPEPCATRCRQWEGGTTSDSRRRSGGGVNEKCGSAGVHMVSMGHIIAVGVSGSAPLGGSGLSRLRGALAVLKRFCGGVFPPSARPGVGGVREQRRGDAISQLAGAARRSKSKSADRESSIVSRAPRQSGVQ